ncbi:MAG: serine/threonine-protein kinase RsbW [Polaribacter sp.]|jgi:serine/threonine-protein kinase RsbW
MSKQHQILSLASDPKNVSRVEPFVELVFKEYQLSPDIYGNILISLTEAVTNAIMHGNKSDISKLVRVQTRKFQSQMAFLISDEGIGFDYETLPDPTAPENLLKIGGRGVFLMQELSDDVVFHDDGRTIEIKFNI